MSFEYKFNAKHVDLALEQVWEAKAENDGSLQVYNDLAEYEYSMIKEYVPHNKLVLNVAEFGAGLGRGSIYLNTLFKWPKFWLLDRHGRTDNSGAYNPKEDEFYSDFDLTSSFCKLNGLYNFELFDTEKDDWSKLPKMDFIFSFCSLGMHVPISRYMNQLMAISKINVTMIFGTRSASYDENTFKDYFEESIFLPQEHKPPFPQENWLILRGLKNV